MRILILGSGGREHVFAWMFSKSVDRSDLFVAPGNAGTEEVAQNVNIGVTEFDKIGEFCVENQIDVLVPGSEDPLVYGIVDYFKVDPKLSSVYVWGPSKAAAELEGSKDFAKRFMERHDIPTARYASFNENQVDQGKEFLSTLKPPYVLKADGLAAGKGVLILDSLQEAEESLEKMLVGHQFGEASAQVVIEEYLDGIEFSVFVVTDGENYVLLPEAKDYKRIGEGDQGLNTGGMGAVSPVPFFSDDIRRKVEDRIIKPTVDGLRSEELEYQGFIFFGLMLVDEDPFVIEYNVRMGDPETEVVFPRVKTDIVELVEKTRSKRLNNVNLEIDDRFCTTVFMVSGGYPEKYEKGKAIEIGEVRSQIFHAGTRRSDGQLLTNGGRVIAVSSFGNTMDEALKISYESIEHISFDSGYYRRDIGNDLREYLSSGSES